METRRLEYFMKIVECGSISRAALHLGLAQPALSQQLAVLEREMQATLVTRSASGILPTQAGQALYDHGQVLLRHLEQAQAEVRSLAGASEVPVSLGLPLSTALLLSVPLVEAVRRRNPNIRLRLIEDLSVGLLTLMREKRIDLAILFASEETRRFQLESLWTERMFLIAPAGSTLPDPIGMDALSELDLILPSPGNGARSVTEAAIARLGRRPRIVAELNSLPTLKAAVQEGLGYTVLPWTAVHDDVLAGRLRTLDVLDDLLRREVILCATTKSLPTSVIRLVATTLRSVVASKARSGSTRGMTFEPSR